MEKAISNIKDFPQALLSWLNTRQDVLYLKISSNNESPDTYFFMRKPIDHDMECILTDNNDASLQNVLACVFVVFGFYSKKKKTLVPTISRDMMAQKYWEGVFILRDKYLPVTFYENKIMKNLEVIIVQFLKIMFKDICLGEKVYTDVSTELKRKFLVSITEYIAKREKAGNTLNTTQMYLSPAWDEDMETYLKRKSSNIFAEATYIGRSRRFFNDRNLATYGAIYMLYPEDFFNRLIQRMYDNNFYVNVKEHDDNDILRKYVQIIMEWLITYVQISAKRMQFKPTPELKTTRNILQGLWALKIMGYFPKTIRAGIIVRTDKYPQGVSCMASIKCDALDVGDELVLYKPSDIKIIAPEEMKGATISEEFPVKASDIYYLTYRNKVIYHKRMKNHD